MPSFGITRNLVEDDGVGDVTVGSIVTSSTQSGNKSHHIINMAIGGTLTVTNNGTSSGATASGALFTAPTGIIWYHPGGGSLTLARVGTNATNITATAACVVGVGTAQPGTDNATLLTTEANLIPSTTFTLVSGSTGNSLTPTTSNVVDGGTAGSTIYLNVAIPATNETGSSAVSVVGNLAVAYIRPGELG